MLIYLTFLLVAVCIVFFFLYIRERQQRYADRRIADRDRAGFSERLRQMDSERTAYLEEKIMLGKQLSAQKVRNETLERELEEQLKKQQELLAENRLHFEHISNRLLEENASRFARQNQENLNLLLKPFQEKIKDFEKKVEETYQRESNERFSLKAEFQKTLELNKTLSRQADNLTKALKADSKSQGNWGEYLLEKILESAGLREDIHYKRQVTVTNGDGKVLRPDVVLYLPEKKHIVIDAKMSLKAYEQYFSADQETERAAALKAHISSVKRHVDELSRKDYERLFEHAPDFVLMFIPVEPAYGLALMKAPELYENAFRKKVILVSVSSLMATLRIIESVWRLEKQNNNAREIIETGNRLYDKLVGFVADMEHIGQKLSGAQEAYHQAFKKLSSGKGNLIRNAEKMRKLGLNPKKQLPGMEE